MISASDFVATLDNYGVECVTGVPCSYFNGPIVQLTNEGRYVPAANEGAAFSIAAGAAAGGRRAVVFSQNSGFGNLINPLTSLSMPYDIPVLLFMSLRGWPDPEGDEPQHAVMGTSTHGMLDAMGVRHWTLDRDSGTAELDEVLAEAAAELEQGRPAVVLVAKGVVGKADDTAELPTGGLARAEAVESLMKHVAPAAVVATTGYTARELFARCDAPTNFYMQGSMGHGAAFGLGTAQSLEDTERVLVLDGDGAALMHLGTMSTVGAAAPANLTHVVLDNGSYDSTGAQPTTSPSMSFTGVAQAMGYRTTASCSTVEEVAAAVGRTVGVPGPHFIVVQTQGGTGDAPPRATSALSAPEIHARFAGAVSGRAEWSKV